MKTHIFQQTIYQLRNNISNYIIFGIQGTVWDLSMRRMIFKFTKRTT